MLDGAPARNSREVPRGEEGLLYIAGPSVFSGYWGRPAETAAAFIERGGARWYNTGDVVQEHAVDGFIYVGRRDRMVKRRGYRIELGEMENGLYKHPAVTRRGRHRRLEPAIGVPSSPAWPPPAMPSRRP